MRGIKLVQNVRIEGESVPRSQPKYVPKDRFTRINGRRMHCLTAKGRALGSQARRLVGPERSFASRHMTKFGNDFDELTTISRLLFIGNQFGLRPKFAKEAVTAVAENHMTTCPPRMFDASPLDCDVTNKFKQSSSHFAFLCRRLSRSMEGFAGHDRLQTWKEGADI